jgi:hypothetical protein
MEFRYIDNNGVALDDYGHEFRGEDGAIVIVPPEDRGFYDIAHNADFLNQKWLNRFQIFATDDGFMAYDHDCDEYLADKNGDNCFNGYSYAKELIDDAVLTVLEHQGD